MALGGGALGDGAVRGGAVSRLGLHDRNADQLEGDDIERMRQCAPGDIVSLHQHRDRWPALLTLGARLHARLDFRGPLDNAEGDAAEVASLARSFPGIYSWRARNEPNLETPSATPDSWYRYNVDWLKAARRLCPAGTRLAVGAISPDYGGAWTDASIRAARDGGADILDWHVYGDLAAISLELTGVRNRWSGPLLVTETNPGLGSPIDFEKWAADLDGLRHIADRLELLGCVLFSWVWDRPESPNVPNVKGSVVEPALARLNSQMTQPTPGGDMTFIDPADLALTHGWQDERNNNNEDPSDGAAYLAWLKGIGKDYTQPRKYGAIVIGGAITPAPSPGLPISWAPIDLRGKLPTRPGTTGQYGPRVVVNHSDRSLNLAESIKRSLAAITGRTIHYTASPRRSGLAAVKAIAAFQVGPNAQEDFPAIAYSLIVDGAGTVFWLHDLNVRVWHSGAKVNGVSRNVSHVGICFIGATAPTPDQILGLARACVWADRQLGRALSLEGHKDPPYATTCPGADWPKWRAALEQAIAGYR